MLASYQSAGTEGGTLEAAAICVPGFPAATATWVPDCSRIKTGSSELVKSIRLTRTWPLERRSPAATERLVRSSAALTIALGTPPIIAKPVTCTPLASSAWGKGDRATPEPDKSGKASLWVALLLGVPEPVLPELPDLELEPERLRFALGLELPDPALELFLLVELTVVGSLADLAAGREEEAAEGTAATLDWERLAEGTTITGASELEASPADTSPVVPGLEAPDPPPEDD